MDEVRRDDERRQPDCADTFDSRRSERDPVVTLEQPPRQGGRTEAEADQRQKELGRQ